MNTYGNIMESWDIYGYIISKYQQCQDQQWLSMASRHLIGKIHGPVVIPSHRSKRKNSATWRISQVQEKSGEIYPLVNVNKKLWKITIFNGKTHYFDWAIFNSYVKLPEGTSEIYRPNGRLIHGDFAEPFATIWNAVWY